MALLGAVWSRLGVGWLGLCVFFVCILGKARLSVVLCSCLCLGGEIWLFWCCGGSDSSVCILGAFTFGVLRCWLCVFLSVCFLGGVWLNRVLYTVVL